MTTLQNIFEGGTNGVAVSAANSGGASLNAFDAVSIGTNATGNYDNTHVNTGTLASTIATGASSALVEFRWTTSMGTQGQVWFRQYLYFTANPSGFTPKIFVPRSGVTTRAEIGINTSGKLVSFDKNLAGVWTFTNAIPLNQWFRVEGFVIGSATVGQIETKLFSTASSTTATETQTSGATVNTGGTFDTYPFGLVTTAAANVPAFWMDDLGLSSTGYLGPFVPPGGALLAAEI